MMLFGTCLQFIQIINTLTTQKICFNVLSDITLEKIRFDHARYFDPLVKNLIAESQLFLTVVLTFLYYPHAKKFYI